MAFGKTDEQKAAEAAAKEQQRLAQAAAKEQAEFAQTPVGQASNAKQRGDAFFQFETDIATLAGTGSALGSSYNRVKSGGRPDVLGQIEEIGWRLEHVGYVFIETGSTTSNRIMSTGQGTVTQGVVRGIYLFRSTD